MRGIKLEIYRAFHNIWYISALGISCAIAIMHFIQQVLPRTKVIGVFLNIDYPNSLYNSCLMLDYSSFYQYLFYYAVILLGTLPYAVSYYTDLREGYIKNIYVKMNRNEYLIGKYLAVFLSAASICIIPLVLNVYLTALVLPALIPQPGTHLFALVGRDCMFSGIFYSHPLVYIGIYLLIDSVMTGAFACLVLVFSKLIYNRYILLFLPFLIYIVMQTVLQFTPLAQAGPHYVMNPIQFHWESFGVVFIEILLLLAAGFFGFFRKGGRSHEAL